MRISSIPRPCRDDELIRWRVVDGSRVLIKETVSGELPVEMHRLGR
jgi:hypothetical protein